MLGCERMLFNVEVAVEEYASSASSTEAVSNNGNSEGLNP